MIHDVDTRAQALLACCCAHRSLQEEDAVLSGKIPLPVNRLCRVRQWLSEKVTALDAEQAALEGKQMVRTQLAGTDTVHMVECSRWQCCGQLRQGSC
jgi:hypothetical protein